MEKNSISRIHYLDNIKWSLTIVMMIHYVLIYTQEMYPKYKENFDYVSSLDQTFFIDFFFLISGYFLIPSYLKKGQKLFNKDKIEFLLLPHSKVS